MTLDHRIRVLGYETNTRVTVDLITHEALFQIPLWLPAKKPTVSRPFYLTYEKSPARRTGGSEQDSNHPRSGSNLREGALEKASLSAVLRGFWARSESWVMDPRVRARIALHTHGSHHGRISARDSNNVHVD